MTSILFSQMTPPSDLESEFNIWYDTEHVPARTGLDGFTGAKRYRAVAPDSGEYVAVYEATSLAAFTTQEYAALRANPSERTQRILSSVAGFTRLICDERGRVGESDAESYLYAVAFSVPDERAEAYDQWYEDEHIPLLMKAPGWQQIRRFVVTDGVGASWTHLTLHYLKDLSALDSDARARARVAPLRNALSQEPWFGDSMRWVYRPLHVPARDAVAGVQ